MYETILSCPNCGFEHRLVAEDVVAQRDKALAALREMSGYVRAHLAGHDADPELKWALEQSDAAIAEIEGGLSDAELLRRVEKHTRPVAEIEGEATPRVITGDSDFGKIVYEDAEGKPFDPQPIREDLP